MGNSGRLFTIYSTSHKTLVKVSTVVILFFNIAHKRLLIVSIRLSQQPSIHGLRGELNCHFIWCLFKYVVILSYLRFLIASLISITIPMKFVPLSDCIMLTCPFRARNLRNDRIKESTYRSPESSI